MKHSDQHALLQHAVDAQWATLEHIGGKAAQLGGRRSGSHYWHLLLCWRCVRREHELARELHPDMPDAQLFKSMDTERAYNKMRDELIRGKLLHDGCNAHDDIQNHLWFGAIAHCYRQRDVYGHRDDFGQFIACFEGLHNRHWMRLVTEISRGDCEVE